MYVNICDEKFGSGAACLLGTARKFVALCQLLSLRLGLPPWLYIVLVTVVTSTVERCKMFEEYGAKVCSQQVAHDAIVAL